MDNPYIPRIAKLSKIIDEAPGIKTFRIELLDGEMTFIPGQFITITVFGIGEAPFAIASSPSIKKYIEVSVRAVGDVTNALHRLSENSVIGIRGPLGRGLPLHEIRDMNIILIAGGTGLFGISSLLWYIYEHRYAFRDVILLYGVRTPRDFTRRYDIDVWSNRIEIHLTVDKGDSSWRGHVGVVTSLMNKVRLPREDTIAILCGPSPMLKAGYRKLLEQGFNPHNIYVILERHMKCGIGKCGRCMLSNGKYVCIHGPVFRCDEIPERDIE